MDFDFSAQTTSYLRDIHTAGTKMADFLIARLKEKYPRNMHEFFPASMSPVPDTEFLSTYDDETRKEVMECAEAAIIAAQALVEIESRRWPN